MTAVARVQLSGLRHESLFRRLLAVRVVGQLQDGVIQSALAGFILFSPESQNSPAAVVGAFALLLLPYSVIGPFMGVFVDRWRRRQVLLIANLARAVMVLGLIGVTLANGNVLAIGLLVLLVLGTNRLILTALAAALPRTVPTTLLVPANAVAPVAGTVAAAIGAAASVSLSSAVGATQATTAGLLAVATVGLVVTALLSLRIPIAALGPGADAVHETFSEVLAQLRRGAVTLYRTKQPWWAVWGVMAHRAAYGIAVLLVIVASKSVLGSGSNTKALGVFALAIAAAGIAAFIGAVVTPPMVRLTSEARWSTVVVVAAAVLVPAMLLLVTTEGFVAAAAALGFAGQSIKISTDTVVGLTIDDHIRGRVFSLFDVGINVALLLGIAAAGFLIPASGTSVALSIATGGLLAVAAVLFYQSGRTQRDDRTTLGDR